MDAGLGVTLLLLLLLLAPRPAVQNLMAHLRISSMIRCSAWLAFSTSPPAFSMMLSKVSILARSSGYSFSRASKLGWLRKGFSISEKRSVMVWISFRPRDPFYLYDFEAFVHSPSTELG